MLQYHIHKDGSFDITGSCIELTGCYPAVNEIPVRPVKTVTSEGSIIYTLPDGKISIMLRKDGQERIAVCCSAEGLAGIHDLEIFGAAYAAQAEKVFVQGLGMEGPSGVYDLGTDVPDSFGLTAWCRGKNAMIAYAEDHRRYTTVFRTGTRKTYGGKSTEISAGFNLEGTAKEETELPVLFLEESDDLMTGLQDCAGKIARAMHARTPAQPLFFWGSWYHAYENMDRRMLDDYLKDMKSRPEFPFSCVEIDAGYAACPGDWLTASHHWPDGMQEAANAITDAGYRAGIWVAPFIVGENSRLYREHPDWVIRKTDGSPLSQLQCYTEPKLWGVRDSNYYVLDASHPDALAYIRTVFSTLKEWGYTFFKTDFMLWNMQDTSLVLRYRDDLTSVEIVRMVLETIREAIGEESCLLGCIAPFMPFIGFADGMRIAGDCGAKWDGAYGPRNLLRELPADMYFNHVFWQNDPDAMLIRDFDTQFTKEEAVSLTLLQALSGGAVSTSDPTVRLSEERKRLLRFVVPHGIHMPEMPSFGSDKREIFLLHRLDQGMLLFVMNPTEDPVVAHYRISEITGESGWYQTEYDLQKDRDPMSVQEDFFIRDLAPHASVLLFLTKKPMRNMPENLWEW